MKPAGAAGIDRPADAGDAVLIAGEELLRPLRFRLAVIVEEGDDRARTTRPSPELRAAASPRLTGVADHPRAVAAAYVAGPVRGTVIDDDDLKAGPNRLPGQGSQAPAHACGAVERADDDRQISRWAAVRLGASCFT